MRTKLDDHPRFSAPKRPPHSFTVDHYAGQVTYSSLLMMDKNKDFVIAEHAQLMASSEFEFVRWGCQCPGAAAGPAGSATALCRILFKSVEPVGVTLVFSRMQRLFADCYRTVQDHL